LHIARRANAPRRDPGAARRVEGYAARPRRAPRRRRN